MVKFSPLADRIVVKPLEREERTPSGIVLPDTAKEKPKQGRVVTVGDGRTTGKGVRVPFTVKKNDKVLFSSYAGTEITIDGEEYLIMPEEEILAVLQ